ncbi:hypothetical protein JCM14244_11400 [Venenivibrio stagnispumantis]|uniref:dTDP-4-amino-4,6-dideoxygalactose transaminase n=1 Tax=Venenivibrio stagnispumantis TaxID=407998 RepID=A0AA45WN62_9AQUI|nr:DegT/DnrJ/EryC1/StrS family aminotransferase [Venenivibrio stagnispumantis]MCW4573203.1 DegT/DnrJ/EryC1/StrS family aminotransferase [Venenivibrio stagnispumantis]SMP17422.1 dTDP-4-amino-4,6-dideoxygalactose transaminase [Venenivibrio stagnispumantis]
MKYIILDTNIVLDYFIEDRSFHNKVKNFLEKNKEKFKYLIVSYQYDTIFYILRRFLKEANINQKIEEFLRNYKINIISTTGKDNLNSTKYKDIEDGILISVCERIGKDCFILTNDMLLIKEFNRATNIDGFNLDIEEKLPLLNLKLEYISYVEDLENAILKNCISANYILGPEVKELEQKVASYIDTKYAIGCSSGTDALVLSLRALAIKNKNQEYWDKEDLIITTPFTFTATGDSILRAGATPLFVDIDLDTYNINPELVEKAIKKYGKRIKGIVPVHLYGQPCNMDEIVRIAKENDLFIVEDCAQSFGAKWDGKYTGSFGDTGCFSFFPSKNLGGFGDGGMITTNDEKLYELISMLIKHGGKDKYNVDHIGYNARLDTLQAAILLAKMEYIDEFTERRRKIAKFYDENLQNIDWIITPKVLDKAYHVYHQYTIRIKDKNREKVQKMFIDKGIQTMVYYPVPLYKMKVFINNRMEIFGDLKNSEIASQSVLSLPIEPLYGEEEIKKVIDNLKIMGER